MIAVFDIGGPLVLYQLLRSAGHSAVISLVLSGISPAIGVAFKFARSRRVDSIGILVVAGIAVGTLAGLLSGNARLLLLEGSVPTAVFGVVWASELFVSLDAVDTPPHNIYARFRFASVPRQASSGLESAAARGRPHPLRDQLIPTLSRVVGFGERTKDL
jgi:hypothetical protein